MLLSLQALSIVRHLLVPLEALNLHREVSELQKALDRQQIE
jgi:hypothetical protein